MFCALRGGDASALRDIRVPPTPRRKPSLAFVPLRGAERSRTDPGHDARCCFETVIESYERLDPPAAVAWRRWQARPASTPHPEARASVPAGRSRALRQGEVSGKCGVAFEADPCPGGAGSGRRRSGYRRLQVEVASLERQQQAPPPPPSY